MRHCDMEKWAGYFVQQDVLRDLIVEVLLVLPSRDLLLPPGDVGAQRVRRGSPTQ